MRTFLDFEAPIAELEGKIAELKAVAADGDAVEIEEEVDELERKAARSLEQIYANLAPWQKALVARHPERPHFLDYAGTLFEDFTPLAGDRKFAEDRAILGGPARFRGEPVLVIGQEKGHDTQSRLDHNFGMARPEGYRKAVRLMELADRFSLPVVSFVDTAGAYPGIGAEERGQAEAIARSIDCCLGLGVPLVSVVIGEGGSGGAIALAAANEVFMLEHAIYSVISPEGASSILWRDSARAKDAATAMKVTAQDLKRLGVIDRIVSEPVGGAHREPATAIEAAGEAIDDALGRLKLMTPEEVRRARREKFLAIGRSL
ncbi:acetyl-CoA carboxylase carboxyltransferase subunit alpha [Kaustia mangrovi]|uniref:Acetyl-coenzyme A carboxylase carboxyl transferase subunit alpha n=1 Tax=Kaustia mangrovi TaxID=2593653 RepID=A0A7S8C305_9HYPH|nr:acetyl-CoA carboxylase carboxyltransferase subunit alpha [Kaustia mangrovi]QPC42425.1 acetyl-CoA carboxylase carboxyltransferase subunit alpha [Kaustia mangrovi]